MFVLSEPHVGLVHISEITKIRHVGDVMLYEEIHTRTDRRDEGNTNFSLLKPMHFRTS
jgi:predicted RNA-binding protein with RPS1 domain